jgi:RHS repeat-associated protein
LSIVSTSSRSRYLGRYRRSRSASPAFVAVPPRAKAALGRRAGREKDSDASLYYYRARTYDPDTGRFTGKDPAGMADGTNLYVYVGNSPTNFVDPTGMKGRWSGGGTGASRFCDTAAGRSARTAGWAGTGGRGGGGSPQGTCSNWGAVAAGVGLLALVGILGVVATILTGGTIWLEPHWVMFVAGVSSIAILAIVYGLNQPC